MNLPSSLRGSPFPDPSPKFLEYLWEPVHVSTKALSNVD